MRFLVVFLLNICLTILVNAQVIPLVELQSGGLLGGVENGKYFDAKTTFGKISKNESYLQFDTTGEAGKFSASINEPDVPCEDFYFLDHELRTKPGIGIGAKANWNFMPRPLTKISLTNQTYLNIVKSILRSKGLPNAKATIRQAIKVDLDGDGTDEVVLTANSYNQNISSSVKVNNYSFVLVRKIINGKAKNIMVVEEYVKKNIEFGVPMRFDVSGIADLNGDGKMELVVFGEYYEGSGAGVYEITDKSVQNKILDTSCGV